MKFWQLVNSNWVKILGTIGGLKDALIAAIASGMFVGLLEDTSIKWLGIVGFFLNAVLVQVGNRNTTKEKVADAQVKVAQAMETAISATPGNRQGGFVRMLVLFFLLGFAALGTMSFVSGCVGTREAYTVAKETNDLANMAYVVGEHYSAVLKEAADLRELPGTPQAAIDAMRRADNALRPFIVGDPSRDPPLPSLQSLVATYQAVRDAKSESELQASINAAVRELSNFSKAVKAARGTR